jgi:putative addiction module component (TIGR02574 family)
LVGAPSRRERRLVLRYLEGMAARAPIFDEALQLPASDRAELAAQLLESLEAGREPGVSEAWEGEIRRRVRRIVAGEANGSPWSEVRERILRRLPRP